MRRVYLDHAATTPVRSEVVEAMIPYLTDRFGNPSSVYSWGREARKAIDESRQTVATLLGAGFNEIIFTGGGSEADNLAIKGAATRYRDKGNHIITSAIEHHAVLDTVAWLEKQGYVVTYLPVDADGMVSAEQFERAITDKTILASIMHANNEIGTIQPIAQIGNICRERGVLLHTDAVQTVGSIDVDVSRLPVDLLTLSAHKFYGPKGVGALYVRQGVNVEPLIHGGGQERRKRAGTENVASIVALAKALSLAVDEQTTVAQRLTVLRDRLIGGLEQIPEVRLNGSRTHRLPNNVNVCFRYIEGESLLLNLDMKGIAGSSGSACTSGSLDPSHVLLALGLSHEIAHGSLRLTLGRSTTDDEIDYCLRELPAIVRRLREMSPLLSTQS